MNRIIAVLLVPVLLGFALPAAAQAQTGPQCAALEDDSARLACYDDLFRGADPTADAASVTIESEQLIPAQPSGRAPATITASCEPNGLQIAFGFAGNTLSSLGNDVGITLQYDLARRSSTLPVNGANNAVLIDNTREALAFIDGLAGVDNLTVRITPARTRTLSVRFGVEDFADRVAPVVAACAQ